MKPIRPPVSRRRGTSIIEVIIALSVGASILATAMYTLHTLLNVQNTAARALAESATTGRIAESFRRDVHSALAADLREPEDGDAPHSLRLSLPDGREVHWTWQDDRLTRQTVRDGRREQTERFRIPRGSQVRFAADGEFRILTVAQPHGVRTRQHRPSGDGTPRIVRVEAWLGRDGLGIDDNSRG